MTQVDEVPEPRVQRNSSFELLLKFLVIWVCEYVVLCKKCGCRQAVSPHNRDELCGQERKQVIQIARTDDDDDADDHRGDDLAQY